jgi:hypothetical protein
LLHSGWECGLSVGGAERDPGGTEGRTGESAGLQRRNGLSTSGWLGDRTHSESNRFPIAQLGCSTTGLALPNVFSFRRNFRYYAQQ